MKNKRKEIECISHPSEGMRGKELTSARCDQSGFILRVISCSVEERREELLSYHQGRQRLGYQLADSLREERFRALSRELRSRRDSRDVITTTVRVFAFPLSETETYGGRMIRYIHFAHLIRNPVSLFYRRPSNMTRFLATRRDFIDRKYR